MDNVIIRLLFLVNYVSTHYRSIGAAPFTVARESPVAHSLTWSGHTGALQKMPANLWPPDETTVLFVFSINACGRHLCIPSAPQKERKHFSEVESHLQYKLYTSLVALTSVPVGVCVRRGEVEKFGRTLVFKTGHSSAVISWRKTLAGGLSERVDGDWECNQSYLLDI